MNVAKLRGIISERGMSQREVAKAIGISEKTFYTKMKNGKFGTDEAEKMIDLLRIENPADILLRSQQLNKLQSKKYPQDLADGFA